MRPNLSRRLLWILGAVVLLSAVGVALLIFTRHRHERGEHERLETAANKGPRVYVAKVEKTPGRREVTLPGDVRAFRQAAIQAKVQGYVRELRVDKGDRVKAGQVLGVIESPETDQQVLAARSTLTTQRRITARTRALEESGIASKQDVDLANESLAQAAADLKRLEALQEYQVLRAPFDGVVTARNVDPGALVAASASSPPLLEVADPSQLRVTVYVGQDIATSLEPGNVAEIVQDEHPERVLHGNVTRRADALDPRTRTMLVEVVLDNRERVLVPGVFVQVTLHLDATPRASVPTEALLVRGDQTMVALVKDGRVRLQAVEPGVNDGQRVQLKGPLPEGALVALNLPIELGNGSPLQPQERPERDPTSEARGGSGAAGR